jgi:predicted nucleic acid-binding protein
MTIVVDASVAAKWLFEETDSAEARRLLDEIAKGRFKSLAPDILPAEIANSLSKRVFRGVLQPLEAEAQYERFRRSCPALISNEFLASAALRLALRHRHPVYDCLYVALALETACPLVTADAELYRAFSPTFPEVRLLRDWS